MVVVGGVAHRVTGYSISHILSTCGGARSTVNYNFDLPADVFAFLVCSYASCKCLLNAFPIGDLGIWKFGLTVNLHVPFTTRNNGVHTSATTSNPPLNHFCFVRFCRDHSSSTLMVLVAPSLLPALLRTIHARGTFSSDVRPPLTPATTTSSIRRSGWANNAISSSDGETWTPETLRVSFALSTKLSDVQSC